MANETVANLENDAISHHDDAGKYPLEEAADTRTADNTGVTKAQDYARWEQLPDDQHYSDMTNVYVYLD